MLDSSSHRGRMPDSRAPDTSHWEAVARLLSRKHDRIDSQHALDLLPGEVSRGCSECLRHSSQYLAHFMYLLFRRLMQGMTLQNKALKFCSHVGTLEDRTAIPGRGAERRCGEAQKCCNC